MLRSASPERDCVAAHPQPINFVHLEDRYLKFVRWSEEDALHMGYCPDLFPWGGVCHAATEQDAYRQLSELVREEVQTLSRERKPLPDALTRLRREAVPA